ncbi:hypothetical protein N7523_006650 [Penicillium sp. IBT 18751x]|nr:hypothetical protein N7523_006650 [Penicillium sp. IBT 18751x]
MPRGRPKIQVSPCKFCNMQFKRVEHLQRHERIRGFRFISSLTVGTQTTAHNTIGLRTSLVHLLPRDLLSRHLKTSHSQISAAVTGTNSSPANAPIEAAETGLREYPLISQTVQPQVTNESMPTFIHGARPSPAETSKDATRHPIPATSFASDLAPGLSSNDYTPSDPVANLSLNSINEFEFLWNNSSELSEFLPSSFFDTNYSLSDLWQTDTFRANDSVTNLPQYLNGGSQPTPRISERSASSICLSSRLPPLEPDSLFSHHERLPNNELNSHRGDEPPPTNATAGLPWNISSLSYDRICSALLSNRETLPASFVIPSRHTMSRYIEGYFRGFHEHFPFMHPATLTIDTLQPELFLAISAIGAFYRFEQGKGYELYLASKAMISRRLEQRSEVLITTIIRDSSNTSKFGARATSQSNFQSQTEYLPGRSMDAVLSQTDLQILQSLVILMAMTSWADIPAVQDAFAMAGQLAGLVRGAGLDTPDEIVTQCSWTDWIQREERRRTLFMAYIVLNLNSITFDVPPLILNYEIRLCLPHCNTEWVKNSAAEWQETRKAYGHTECDFQSTFKNMLAGQDVHTKEPLSALGNYALINALIQYIFFERQAATSHTLRVDSMKMIESALQSWQRSWEATQETSLDPSSPSGPLGFNSAALLRLAYLRLNANLGPCRNLLTQDPRSIAECFTDESRPLFTRSLHIDRAVLQCIHALSIPVRVGISFSACTQNMTGGIQHPLCTLECAILLSRWLGTISNIVQTSSLGSLREDERKLLGMIASLIKETDFADTLETNEEDGLYIRRMAATVVRLWAKTFHGVHIFQVVRVIGDTLSIGADILQARIET